MEKDPLKLLEKYKAGNCSDKEKAVVESWYLELQSAENVPSHAAIEESKEQVWASLSANKHNLLEKRRIARIYLRKVAAWAAAIFIVGAISFLYLKKSDMQHLTVNNSANKEIVPGGDKAFLTLADGRKISLTDAANGELAKQEGLVIKKTADGQLVYTVADVANGAKSQQQLFNTIETPNGGKYQINLPDGTRVWLNAASSLRYPTKFTDDNRTVELSGEGYFEVAKIGNKKLKHVPFIVKSKGQEVEVLGTHFNINSYYDEADVKTTLLEGSVRVAHQGRKNVDRANKTEGNGVILKPGEQSQVTTQAVNVRSVDVEGVMAWKNGDFVFEEEDLKSIMRKVARWYDVEVLYKGDFTNMKFGGLISRSKNISSVLGIMESTGRIHFDIDGKKVTVLHNAE